MKKIMSLGLFLGLVGLSGLVAAESKLDHSIYLSDFLRIQAFYDSWDDLMRQPGIPNWLAEGSRNYPGVETPAAKFGSGKEIGYVGFSVCKPHDCPTNLFYVIFNMDGRKAWGYTPGDKGKSLFFNRPDRKVQQYFQQLNQTK